jgi:hypothetical protein
VVCGREPSRVGCPGGRVDGGLQARRRARRRGGPDPDGRTDPGRGRRAGPHGRADHRRPEHALLWTHAGRGARQRPRRPRRRAARRRRPGPGRGGGGAGADRPDGRAHLGRHRGDPGQGRLRLRRPQRELRPGRAGAGGRRRARRPRRLLWTGRRIPPGGAVRLPARAAGVDRADRVRPGAAGQPEPARPAGLVPRRPRGGRPRRGVACGLLNSVHCGRRPERLLARPARAQRRRRAPPGRRAATPAARAAPGRPGQAQPAAGRRDPRRRLPEVRRAGPHVRRQRARRVPGHDDHRGGRGDRVGPVRPGAAGARHVPALLRPPERDAGLPRPGDRPVRPDAHGRRRLRARQRRHRPDRTAPRQVRRDRRPAHRPARRGAGPAAGRPGARGDRRLVRGRLQHRGRPGPLPPAVPVQLRRGRPRPARAGHAARPCSPPPPP